MSKTVIRVDSTMFNSFSACPRLFKNSFVDNWRLTTTSEAIEKGDLTHVILAEYYRQRMDKSTNLQFQLTKAIEVGRARALDLKLDPTECEIVIRVCIENIAHWAQDGWTVLFVEKPFSRTIFEDEKFIFLWEGIIDLGVDTFFGPMIVDHKTSKRRQDPMKLANQFFGYCWALDLQHLMINRIGFQRTVGPNEKFQRQQLSYAKELIREWEKWTIYRIKELCFAYEHNLWAPNFTACDKYGGCVFKESCETVEEARAFKIESRFFRGEPWDPFSRDEEKGPDRG